MYRKKYDEEDLRRQFCKEALRYGRGNLGRLDKPVKVTVILNPMAKHGKAKKLFEKNVAPLLYLAGFEVSVIKTEHEGQAKQYMDVLEEADYIVVAGGDGTLQEVVTGLLRRKDEKLAHVPIGVVPLGVVNSFASSLFGDREKEMVSWLLDASMSVVRGFVKPSDVLSIRNQDDKTVYAVSGVDCGLLRKAIDRVNKQQKYWYLGALKHRITLIRTAIATKWSPSIEAEVTYTNTCSGCSKCRPVPAWRWWHFLFKPKVQDFTKITNTNCGVEHNQKLNGIHMVINSPSIRNHDKGDGDHGINLAVMPDLDRFQFVKHGMSLIGIKPYAVVSELREPLTDIATLTFTPKNIDKDEGPFYAIDNEEFEGLPISVELLKNRIRVFAPADGVS